MNKKELWVRIDKILREDWDPIGIGDYDESNQEYQGYIPSVIKLLDENADELKIAKLLYNHASINMGISSDLTSHIYIAKKIKTLND